MRDTFFQHILVDLFVHDHRANMLDIPCPGWCFDRGFDRGYGGRDGRIHSRARSISGHQRSSASCVKMCARAFCQYVNKHRQPTMIFYDILTPFSHQHPSQCILRQDLTRTLCFLITAWKQATTEPGEPRAAEPPAAEPPAAEPVATAEPATAEPATAASVAAEPAPAIKKEDTSQVKILGKRRRLCAQSFLRTISSSSGIRVIRNLELIARAAKGLSIVTRPLLSSRVLQWNLNLWEKPLRRRQFPGPQPKTRRFPQQMGRCSPCINWSQSPRLLLCMARALLMGIGSRGSLAFSSGQRMTRRLNSSSNSWRRIYCPTISLLKSLQKEPCSPQQSSSLPMQRLQLKKRAATWRAKLKKIRKTRRKMMKRTGLGHEFVRIRVDHIIIFFWLLVECSIFDVFWHPADIISFLCTSMRPLGCPGAQEPEDANWCWLMLIPLIKTDHIHEKDW